MKIPMKLAIGEVGAARTAKVLDVAASAVFDILPDSRRAAAKAVHSSGAAAGWSPSAPLASVDSVKPLTDACADAVRGETAAICGRTTFGVAAAEEGGSDAEDVASLRTSGITDVLVANARSTASKGLEASTIGETGRR
jgi:hypothetical protein